MHKIKIFMVGMLSIEYVRQNWLDIMREMYDVTYISVSILNRVMSKEKVTEYLLDVLRSDNYDYVFAYPDGCHQMFSDRFFAEAKKIAPVISFYSDDEPNIWMKNNLRYDFRSDLIVTHSARAYEYRKNAGYGDGMMRVQWGYNPAFFYKTDDEKDIDVVFMGSNFFVDGRYIYDGTLRQEILTDVYEFCAKKGFDFKIYGSKWNLHPVLKNAWGGFASDEEIVHVINRAKIVIGLGYTQDSNPTFHTKLKHFEIAGCGSLELVNENPDLYDIFEDSVPQFKDSNELCRLIEYYLIHEDEREKKASAAYEICRSSCTMRHRIQTIFEYSERLFDKKYPTASSQKKTEKKAIKIKTLQCSDTEDGINKVLDYLKSPDEDITHLQVLDEGTKLLDLNEGLVSKDLLIGSSIECCTLFSLGNGQGYDLSKEQRRCLDDNAWLAQPGVTKESTWYDFSKKHLRGFDKDGVFYPLCSFIFDIGNAGKYIESFIASDYSDLESITTTERISTDIRVFDEDDAYKNREAKALKAFLNKCPEGETVVIWGAYGDLIPQIFKAISEADYRCMIAFADQNSDCPYVEVSSDVNAREKKKIPLINSAELLNGSHISPYAVIISAIYSGESMKQLINGKRENCKVLPLYDLNDEIWKQEGITT